MEHAVKELINAVIEKKNEISYINLDENNRYLGWTHDFGLTLPDHSRMRLDLHNESERFLLFVLASAYPNHGGDGSCATKGAPYSGWEPR